MKKFRTRVGIVALFVLALLVALALLLSDAGGSRDLHAPDLGQTDEKEELPPPVSRDHPEWIGVEPARAEADPPSPEGVETPGEEYVLRLRWLSAPPPEGEETVIAGLAGAGGAIVDAYGVLGREHVRIHGELPDGTYAWRNSPRLRFPSVSARLLVENGVPRISGGAGQASFDAISVYYCVPVSLLLDLDVEDGEATVNIMSRHEEPFPNELRTSQLATLRHGEPREAYVPAAKLDFQHHRPMGLSLPTAATPPVGSSLGDRIPESGEVIRISLQTDRRLIVHLNERSPGDLQRTLRHHLGREQDATWEPPERVAATISIQGWGSRGSQFSVEGEIARDAQGRAFVEATVPPIQNDAQARLTVLVGDGSRWMTMTANELVGINKAPFFRSDATYQATVEVITYDWTVRVEVSTRAGAPVRDYQIRIRPYMRVGDSSYSFGSGYTLRTDVSGVAEFRSLPAGSHLGFQFEPENGLHQDLNPEVRHQYRYRGSSLEFISLVLPEDVAAGLTFQFSIPDELEDWFVPHRSKPDGMTILVGIPYLIISHSDNHRLVGDIKSGT
jgi:hypothetical protein